MGEFFGMMIGGVVAIAISIGLFIAFWSLIIWAIINFAIPPIMEAIKAGS